MSENKDLTKIDNLIDNKINEIENFDKSRYEKQIETLQRKLDELEDLHKESVFWFIFIIIILIDIIGLDGNHLKTLIIALFELVGLIGAAEKYGQEKILKLFYEIKNLIFLCGKSFIRKNLKRKNKTDD